MTTEKIRNQSDTIEASEALILSRMIQKENNAKKKKKKQINRGQLSIKLDRATVLSTDPRRQFDSQNPVIERAYDTVRRRKPIAIGRLLVLLPPMWAPFVEGTVLEPASTVTKAFI